VKLTVITPAYNVAPYIGDTIASVIAQSHANWAMVIVDDGSTDDTAKVVEGFNDPRIRLVRQENKGVSAARNRGMEEGDDNTEAAMFLDGDDYLAPDAFARLIAALEAWPRAVAAYGPYAYVEEDAHPGSRAIEVKNIDLPSGDILEALVERNLFANGGHMLIRRSELEQMTGFREDLKFGEDWEFWVRLALRGPFALVPGSAPLLFVRRRPSSAYLRMAMQPEAYEPCVAAIFDNPRMHTRLGTGRRHDLRAQAMAENAWVVGRELIRHGREFEGRAMLRESIAMKPSPKRLALLAMAYFLDWVPVDWRGPFRPYTGAPAAQKG